MWEGKERQPAQSAESEAAGAEAAHDDDDDFGDDFDEFAEEGGDDDDFGDFDEADADAEQTPVELAREAQTLHTSLAGLVSSRTITANFFHVHSTFTHMRLHAPHHQT